ncbi:MAG: S4 domain-containing protein [Acutalibacteraceae bacterium]
MKERLDKILASQNIGSRKDVGLLIRKGAITVNGLVVKKSDTKVDGDIDEICVNGTPLQFKRHLYLMMNKPAGYYAARDSCMQTVLTYCLKYIAAVGYFPQEDWTAIRRAFNYYR